jgi:hypothetical protein
MPKKPGREEKSNVEPSSSLRDQVKDALMSVITDVSASAAAKASAGRTLMEFFGDDSIDGRSGRRSTELTADELDDEIARLTPRKN